MNGTDYLAIYAAALSTVVFTWNVLNARSRIRVQILPGCDEVDGKFISGVYISIQNMSGHQIHLKSLSILYPLRRASIVGRIGHLIRFRRWPKNIGWVHTSLSYYKISDGLPITLDARSAHGFLVPDDALRSVLAKASRNELMVEVQDQLWRRACSPTLKIDWLSSKSPT